MSTEILVNIAQHETRVALVEGGALQEVFIQRAARHGLVGNIYKGRVQRVLPGMQAAFIDIGLERTAFLHAADMRGPDLNGDDDGTAAALGASAGDPNSFSMTPAAALGASAGDPNSFSMTPAAAQADPTLPIDRLLSEGQEVLVQVLKDPLGSKGARLTTLLSIPSRYLVLLPPCQAQVRATASLFQHRPPPCQAQVRATASLFQHRPPPCQAQVRVTASLFQHRPPHDPHVGVSARIEDEAERTRLKSILRTLVQQHVPGFGVIVRTAGENADEAALAADLQFLVRLWATVNEKCRVASPGQLVHGDLPLSMRILRDLLGTEVERIRIDNAAEFERVQRFAQTLVPLSAHKVEYYDGAAPGASAGDHRSFSMTPAAAPGASAGDNRSFSMTPAAPIFDLFGVEDDLNRALGRRVDLKSGGHLVFDQTEAMSTVDVNTGAYTGHTNLEDTVLKTNLEAAQAIARQLRLRNLGGLIVLDFIDMKNEAHRAQVLRALEKELRRDPARTTVVPFSPLGLVEMTRKRTRESLGHILCEPCPACEGRGAVKTADTVSHEILREITRAARQFEAKEFRVIAAPEIVARLTEEHSQALAELEAQLHRPIRLQAESQYARHDFDVVPT